MKSVRPLFITVLALCAYAIPTYAAQFPIKPVRMITPYPPGGGTDAVARPLANHFSKAWGHPVVVDNRGSGGGVIAHAAPDAVEVVAPAGQLHAPRRRQPCSRNSA